MTRWLDLSNTANKLEKTYFKGFVDVSGGGIHLRNDASINFYKEVGSTKPIFSIHSTSLSVEDDFGAVHNIDPKQLIYIEDLTQDIQSQFDGLVEKTKNIKTGSVSDQDTMLLFDETNNRIITYADIIPSVAFQQNLGTPTMPFGSLYLSENTIHFINDTTKQHSASISYNPYTGSLDLSSNGFTSSVNNTRIVNGVLETPVISYDGNVGIGIVGIPTSALDISGELKVSGNSTIDGNLIINNGNVIMDGNLIIGNTIYEGGVPLSSKYLGTDSPVITGEANMTNVFITNNLSVLGDSSFNGRIVVGGDVSMNNNLLVKGNLETIGTITTTTPEITDNSTFVATTAFVKNQGYVSSASPSFTGTVTMQTANISQRMAVNGDVSLNSKLYVFSAATFNNKLTVANDATMNGRLIVMGDTSLNGNVLAPTQANSENSTRVATTAFVKNQGYALLSSSYFTGDVSLNSRLYVAGTTNLNGDINLNGNSYALTQTNSDSSTKVATTAFVKNQGYATLESPSFTGVASLQRANISQGLSVVADSSFIGNVFVNGNITTFTQSNSDNSTKVATTQFVKNQGYSTIASPTFTGSVTMPTTNINEKLLVSGDVSLNSRLYVAGETILIGNVIVPTQSDNDNSTKVATTAFVKNQGYAKLTGAAFTGDISLNTNLYVGQDASFNRDINVLGNANLLGNAYTTTPETTDNSTLLATTAFVKNQGYSTVDSPQFTGVPTAPTPSYGTNSTQVATTEFVVNQLYTFINSNQDVYNSLQQLSLALANTDASFATALAYSVGLKANSESPIFTGTVTIPILNVINNLFSLGDVSFNSKLSVTGDVYANANIYTSTVSTNDNSTKVATTAFVKNQGYAKLSGASFSGNVSTSENLSVSKNMTIDNQLFVINDSSMNGNMVVYGNTTLSQYVNILNTLLVGGDVSMNGNLFVAGNSIANTPATNDNSTLVATTAFVKNQGYAQLSGANFTGDVSLDSHLLVSNDVSMNGNLFVSKDLSMNSHLFVGDDVSMSGKLFVSKDVSMNGNIMVGETIYEQGVALINKYATLASPTFTGIVNGITASMVGLANVNDTADIDKEISTKTQDALNLKSNISSPTFTGIVTIPNVIVNNTIKVDGDASLNGNLFVAGDMSLNGSLTTITPLTSDNSTKVATTEYVKNQGFALLSGAEFTGDVTMDNNLSVTKDANLNNRLFVANDSSMNGKLYVSGNTLLNGGLVVNQDLSLNGKTSLAGDVSMNNNLFVAGTIKTTTQTPEDSSTKVATTAFVKNQGYAQLSGASFSGDVSIDKRLYVLNDVSLSGKLFSAGDVSLNSLLSVGGDSTLNANLYVTGKTVATGDISLNNRLFVSKDVSLNGKLFVSGDATMMGNLLLAGNLTAVTPSNDDSSTKVATTAFVKNQQYAPIASPTFTGTATATTMTVTQNLITNSDAYLNNNLFVTANASVGGDLSVIGNITSTTPSTSDNSTTVATTAYVKAQPFAPLSSPTFTGVLSAETANLSQNLVVLGDSSMNGNLSINGTVTSSTPLTSDNSTKVATTAFVKAQPFAPLSSPTFTGVLSAETANLSQDLSVLGDSSMNGNLSVGKTIYENGSALITKYATLASPTFTGDVSGITKIMVGLGNVNNTSDLNKPVSTATQTALNLKANLASPTFTGIVNLPETIVSQNVTILGDSSMNGNLSIDGNLITKTQATNDNSTKVATTAYVKNQGFALLSGAEFTGDVSLNSKLTVIGNVSLRGVTTAITQVPTDDSTKIATTEFVQSVGYARLASPAFTGVPTAPTADVSGAVSNQIATTSYVSGAITSFFNTASTQTLNAINQLSQALTNTDTSFATTLAVQLATKADLVSPSFTGTVNLPQTNVSQNLFVGGDVSLNGALVAGGFLYEKGVALVNKYATLASPTFTGEVSGISKSMVGLGSVENTADIDKPVSTATQTALNLKANIASPSFTGSANISRNLVIGGDVSMNGNLFATKTIYENSLPLSSVYATLASPTFTGDVSGITKTMVGLGNIENTADIDKPVSTATQTALNLKANLASPAFTGSASITQGLFVGSDMSMNGRLYVGSDVSVNGNIYSLTPLTSDNSNRVATTEFVKNQNAGYAQLTGAAFTGDISINTKLSVGGDVSMNGNLFVIGNITGNYPSNSIPLSAVIGGLGTNVDLSTNQTVYGVKTFMNDVSLNSRLFLNGNITMASNNLVSSLYQTAVAPTSTTISNLSKVTNNYNGTFINVLEISKLNGLTIAYNTSNGAPVLSEDGGQTWSTMSYNAGNTGFNGMLCISPDGRIRIKQEIGSSGATLYVSTNWGASFTSVSLAQSYIYTNSNYGYNTYNDQAYAFSQDGTTLYLIARDSNNTIVVWKNTDSTFTSFTNQGLSWNYTLSNAPRAIVTSGNGQYVLTITGIVTANGTFLFKSSNSGASYTKTANSLNTTWNSIAISYSGQYQSATTNTTMYQSNDYGVTWAVASGAPTGKWNSISMSNNGKNRLGCIDTSYQYLSLDYGSTWNIIPNSFGNWKKAVLVDMSNNDTINIYSHDGVNVYNNSYKYADVYQKTTINSDMTITTPYYYLNNIGKQMNVVKTNSFTSDYGNKMAISDNGQYILLPIVNKQTLISQDYGLTWNGLTGLSAQTGYNYAAMSGNGQYMFVRKGSVTYWSTNYGTSWSLFSGVSSTDYTNGIAVSYTGQYMVYAGLDSNSVSSVYLSSNYGSTWASVATFAVSSSNFSAAISYSGQYISVLSTNSNLLISNNYGATWTTQNVSSCNQICMSTTGQYQTVVSSSSIYSSSNYGQNFNCVYRGINSPNFNSVAMIGTGEYQYAVNTTDNSLYRSTTYGSSWSVVVPNTGSPNNTVVARDGTTMIYGASGDIYLSRVSDNNGSIASTAVSISRKGIISALDLSVNGTISSQSLIVNQIFENGNLLGSKYATINSPSFIGTVSGITSAMVGLGNVNNTTDLNKPISTATQSALNLKANVDSASLTGVTSMQNATISQKLFTTGDVSFNSKLFVASDVSINGLLYANYPANTIPITAILGGIPSADGVFSSDVSMNYRLFVANDVSLNSKLFVKSDAIINKRLFVTSDASMSANLYVAGNTILNNNATLNKNLFVIGDASMTGNLYVTKTVYENGSALGTIYATQASPGFTGTANFEKVTISQLMNVNAETNIDGPVTTTGNVNVGGNIFENGSSLITKYATLASPTFTGDVSGITKTMVGLSNVDNTTDLNKPISTETQTALNLKANIDSPTFTGTPFAPTASSGTNTSQLATTAFVQGEIYNLIGTAPSTLNTLQELSTAINSDASFAATVTTQIGSKAPVESPTFTGTATLPNTVITQNLALSGDASFNNDLFVGGDASLNGNVYINGLLIYNNNFSVNSDFFVGGDLSVNGNINGHFKDYSIPSTAIANVRNQFGELTIQCQRADIVTFDEDGFELSRSSSSGGYVETLYSNDSDLSLNGNLYIHGSGSSVFTNALSVDSNLSVTSDASFNGNLYVDKDLALNNNLDLSGSLIAHNNVNVYGIINQYTTTLDQGYIVNYANEANTIQTMQQQIATLQSQLANVLQILANNNIQ